MSLEADYKKLEDAHRRMTVAYSILTEKKIKSKTPELRKALKEMMDICKDMRKSAQEFKEKI